MLISHHKNFELIVLDLFDDETNKTIMFKINVGCFASVYLNLSHGRLWDEPSALLFTPSSRQPLNELDLVFDEVVSEHAILLDWHGITIAWKGLTVGVDKVGATSMATEQGGVHRKGVGTPQEQHTIGQATTVLSHPLCLFRCC